MNILQRIPCHEPPVRQVVISGLGVEEEGPAGVEPVQSVAGEREGVAVAARLRTQVAEAAVLEDGLAVGVVFITLHGRAAGTNQGI